MMDWLELEAARLRIRQFEQRDLEACLDFRRRVLGMEEQPTAVQSWLNWTIDSYRELSQLDQPPYADYAVELKDSAIVVGSVAIVPTVVPWGALAGDPSDSLLSPEVGLFWGILPSYQRQGYATEAAGALLDFLFEQLRIRQVVATSRSDNIASQRTMQKLGMELHSNPLTEPAWCQVVGKKLNPLHS